MGRSIPTDEPTVSYPSLIADTSVRLQQLVNGWRGAERGERNITLLEAETFVKKRLRKYSDPKRQARMFFSDELMQYLAWKAGE